VKWYWPNAILRTIRVNKEKSLFKDPIKIEEISNTDLSEHEENSNEAPGSYAMTIADRALSSTTSKEKNVKTLYQRRLDEFLGTTENEQIEEKEEIGHDSESEQRCFKGDADKRIEEELSDKEEKDEDDEYEDDGEVNCFKIYF
jgi:hypothetical protein